MITNSSQRFTAVALALALTAATVSADLIAHEPFTAASSGIGWTGDWVPGNVNRFNINAGSLNYPGVTSTGEKIVLGTIDNNSQWEGTSAIRKLAAVIDLTTLGAPLYI